MPKTTPIIGQRVPSVDAPEKLTGTTKYVGDLKLPRMLYCKIKRSILPHAELLNIDTSKAEKLAGVKAIVTAKDTPNIRVGWFVKDETLFAHKKVRYIGEPVAAVAACDEATAEEAIQLIDVEYEELPALFDPLEAMKDGAPKIHEDVENYISGIKTEKYGNICFHSTMRKGDVDQGFNAADFVFEDTFNTQAVHQCYLEPQPVLTDIDYSGKITLWTSSSYLFPLRELISEALRIPMNKIRFKAMPVGGAFGGKQAYIYLGICLLLTQKSRLPVKLLLTRQEEFIATNPRHPVMANIKTGVRKDGTILSREVKLTYDTGAFAQEGPGATYGGALGSCGAYNIPNIKIDSYCVYTNKHPFGAMRGYGNPQPYFAGESQIDMIAHELAIDPVEMRLKNCFEKDGAEMPTGQKVYSCGLKETLKIASSTVDTLEKERLEKGSRKVGRGAACIIMGCGLFGSGSNLIANDDGSFTLITGVIDAGQGSATILAQIAAEELGVSLEDISYIGGDTDISPWDFGTVGSRVTRTTGEAVRRAAADLKRQFLELACARLEARIEDLEISDKNVKVKSSPNKSISIQELSLAHIWEKGGSIIGRGSFFDKGGSIIKEQVSGYPARGRPSFQTCTIIAEVEVDTETGIVHVLKCTGIQDVGKCINPLATEGQIEGGIVMGVGYALTEGIQYKDGEVENPNLVDYKIPTALDVPDITPILVEEPDPTGAFGAKGVGEACLIPVAPAIANAIYDAAGIRIKELPITPEKVLKAIKELNK